MCLQTRSVRQIIILHSICDIIIGSYKIILLHCDCMLVCLEEAELREA